MLRRRKQSKHSSPDEAYKSLKTRVNSTALVFERASSPDSCLRQILWGLQRVMHLARPPVRAPPRSRSRFPTQRRRRRRRIPQRPRRSSAYLPTVCTTGIRVLTPSGACRTGRRSSRRYSLAAISKRLLMQLPQAKWFSLRPGHLP